MPRDVCVFKRVEKKYRISAGEKAALLAAVGDQLIPDSHGKSTICSLYLDTPEHLLIRNSIDAVAYKEKLRLRSYGTPEINSRVFLEIKKKYMGVVYKRRVAMTLGEAQKYLDWRIAPLKSQIMAEIDYAMDFYGGPRPAMLVAYEREAYYVKGHPNVRVTFDSAVRYRQDRLLLDLGSDGKQILPDGQYLLEIKTDGTMPLWLAHTLSCIEILPASFSKYGTAYLDTLKKTEKDQKGENHHACNF